MEKLSKSKGDTIKTACVLRWGAYGDAVMATPLFRLLKNEDYKVTFNTTERGELVCRNNPYIDKFNIYIDNTVPQEQLSEYFDEEAKKYDRFINLCESIEKGLLVVEGSPEFKVAHGDRHKLYNVNYYDRTLEIGGFENIKGINGELFFSSFEDRWAKDYRKKYSKKFIVMWSLAGSSFHKIYPYTEFVAKEFMNRHADAMIITVGDDLCRILEWEHPQGKSYSGLWNIRQSMIMTKYVDLVVGTETGILNASGCFETPKIVLLSHSSHENLSKYWYNVYPLSSDAICYPCHQLHYTLESCRIEGRLRCPICMSMIKPEKVLDTMEEIYYKWRNLAYGNNNRKKCNNKVSG